MHGRVKATIIGWPPPCGSNSGASTPLVMAGTKCGATASPRLYATNKEEQSMKKIMTAVALAAFLAPAAAFAQAAPGGSMSGGSAGTSPNGSSTMNGTSAKPSNCGPGDTRPACQQAEVPGTSGQSGSSNYQGSNPSTNSPGSGGYGSPSNSGASSPSGTNGMGGSSSGGR